VENNKSYWKSLSKMLPFEYMIINIKWNEKINEKQCYEEDDCMDVNKLSVGSIGVVDYTYGENDFTKI
jgi:hypothetical protein